MSEVEEFLKQCANKEQHFQVITKKEIEISNQATEVHAKINNGWAKCILNPCQTKILPVKIEEIEEANKVKVYNEKTISDVEIEKFEGKIEQEVVEQYLNTPETNTVEDIQPILSSVTPAKFFQYEYEFPETKDFTLDTQIHITLATVKPKDAKIEEQFTGYLQIYDIKELKPTSEPLFFATQGDKVTFSQTDQTSVHFPVIYSNNSMILLCVLYKTTQVGNKPYSLTYHELFNEQGVFEEFDKFEENWTAIKAEGVRATLKAMKEKQDSLATLQVTSELTAELLEEGKGHYSYTWSDERKLDFLATPLHPIPTDTTPVITIHNINFALNKPPSNSKLIFKAYIMHKLVPSFVKEFINMAEQQIIGTSVPYLWKDYTSALFPSVQEVEVDDCIRIFVNDKFTPETHLVIHMEGHNIENNKVTNYKIGIIPLYNVEGLIQNQDKFILYDPKSVPKDYIKKGKKPGKTFLTCKIEFPPIFFPQVVNLKKIVNAGSPIQFELPEENEQLENQIIPITSKFLSLINQQSLLFFLEFLTYFPCEKIKQELRPWIYNTFNPTKEFVEVCTSTFTSVLKQLIESSKKEKPELTEKERRKSDNKKVELLNKIEHDEKLICTFIERSQVILDMLKIGIINHKDTVRYEKIIPFFEILTELFYCSLEFRSFELTTSFVKTYTEFLFILITVIPFKFVAKIMAKVLYALNVLKTAESKNQVAEDEITYLQFLFLSPFSRSRTFIVGLASLVDELKIDAAYSPYHPLLSLINYSVSQALLSKDPKLLDISTTYLSGMVIMEKFPSEVSAKLSFVLFPLVGLISLDFDSESLNNCPDAQLSLIPFVLLLLNKATNEHLQNYFATLAASFKQQFISFLCSMLNRIKNEDCILKYNAFYVQMTNRILQFLLVNIDNLKPVIEKVSQLVSIILCEYQTDENYPAIYNFTAKLINKHSCQHSMIVTLLHLITRKMHSTRCLSTALLFVQFYADFRHNSSVVYSAIETMDEMTAILLGTSFDNITKVVEIYQIFIELIKSLSNSKESEFFAKTEERMKAAFVITNIIKDQKLSVYPVEIKTQKAMQIADQYRLYPSMRKKWLQEICNINSEGNDYISAFIAQLHICALCCTVYEFNREIRYKQEENQPDIPYHLCVVQPLTNAYPKKKYSHNQSYLDFQFYPEVVTETQIEFDKIEQVALDLLSEFTLEDLINQLNKAVEIGLKAKMYYTLRPVYSLLLRSHHIAKEFGDLSKVFKDLGDIYDPSKIRNTEKPFTHDLDIMFHLVEVRIKDKGKMITRRFVYCSEQTTDSTKFIEEILASPIRFSTIFRGLEIEGKKLCECIKYCPKHPNHCSNNEGICVVRLEPTDDGEVFGEHLHCWTHFRTIVNMRNLTEDSMKDETIDNIQYIDVTTKNPVPHYRMATEVDTYKIKSSPLVTAVNELVAKLFGLLKHEETIFIQWFELKEFQSFGFSIMEFLENEKTRIENTINIHLCKENSPIHLFPYMNKKNPEKTKEKIREFHQMISNIFKIYKRIAREYGIEEKPTEEYDMTSPLALKNMSLITNMAKYRNFLEKFCKEYDLPNIEYNDVFFGVDDPMKLKLPFEK